MTAAEATMSTSESAKTKKKRPTPAEQDVESANFISQSRVTIETILNTPEILTLLPKRYTVAKLNEGLAIQSTAQNSFTARQTAIGAETAANTAVTEGRKAAYDRRAEFRGQAERQALGVVGTIPVDTEKLLTQAKASYTASYRRHRRHCHSQHGCQDPAGVDASAPPSHQSLPPHPPRPTRAALVHQRHPLREAGEGRRLSGGER